MKVIIAGSRTIEHDEYAHYRHAVNAADRFTKTVGEITEVVSGTARGPDTLGELFAKANNILITRFKPNWNAGKSAGIIRNTKMGNYADAAIVLWDGESRGSKHMIDYMRSLGKPVVVEIITPVVKHKHLPTGAIKRITPDSTPSNDKAFD